MYKKASELLSILLISKIKFVHLLKYLLCITWHTACRSSLPDVCAILGRYKDIKQNNPQNSQKTMAFPFPRASLLSWAASFRPSSLSPLLPIALSPQIHSPPSRSAFYVSASLSSIQQEESSPRTLPSQIGTTSRWKPMCLYYTQGKCTKVRITPPLHYF